MANVTAVTDATFQTEVLDSAVPVLVDFWAPWCGPCRAIAPLLDELAGEYAGKAKVVKINVDDHQAVAQRYRVSTIPNLIVFKNGQVGRKAHGTARRSVDRCARVAGDRGGAEGRGRSARDTDARRDQRARGAGDGEERYGGSAAGEVRLEAPPGWTVKPALSPVSFLREDEEARVRFMLRPPTGVPAGRYSVRARVSLEGRDYREGYQVIEYPHTTRQHVLQAAEVPVLVLDVEVAPGLRVGYVMGVGDQVPAALQQLGANVTLLDSDELAWGAPSRYDVIVPGVRAYERRADLRANNHRLLTYAEQGGTVMLRFTPLGPHFQFHSLH